MTSPEEFNFLNFDYTTGIELEFLRDSSTEDLIFAYNIDLSRQISI